MEQENSQRVFLVASLLLLSLHQIVSVGCLFSRHRSTLLTSVMSLELVISLFGIYVISKRNYQLAMIFRIVFGIIIVLATGIYIGFAQTHDIGSDLLYAAIGVVFLLEFLTFYVLGRYLKHIKPKQVESKDEPNAGDTQV